MNGTVVRLATPLTPRRSATLHRRHGWLDGEWRDVLVVERLLELAKA
jgi:hypothetical protein